MTIVIIFRLVKIGKTMNEENPAPIRRQTRKCSEKDTCRTIIEGKFWFKKLTFFGAHQIFEYYNKF